jgi:hypothetical protein
MKTILSIDGGGIRGIIPLACLARLEALTGKPSRDLFDMAVGTSTGAIIAAGIALGLDAGRILRLYRDLAREAFRRLTWWKIVLNLGNHRYSSEFIARTLDSLGADIVLNSLPIDILITGKDTGTSRTDFFVRDNPANGSLWGTMLLRDAVLASIAVPTYFPAHTAVVRGETHTWVDGGVGVAGNPCYHAAVEAMHYSAGLYPPGQTRLLSFGTGRAPHRIEAPRANILDWAGWVLAELLEDASDWQTYVTRREYGESGRIDFRRYQLDLTPEVMRELGVEVPPGVDVGKIEMDSAWAVDLLEEIGHRFAERIDFERPGGTEIGEAKGRRRGVPMPGV